MELIIATQNPGKLREFQSALESEALHLHALSDYTSQSVDETGLTFIENALLKARHAASITGLSALADDSGLVVDALQGEPGIFSARYAGKVCTDEDNRQKLLHALQGVPIAARTARFVCVLALLRTPHDPCPLIAEAHWEGTITLEPRGEQGFGYDPLFFVPTYECTAAELPIDTKNRISHRGQALQCLLAQLANQRAK